MAASSIITPGSPGLLFPEDQPGADRAGGKGAALSRLVGMGFRVPAFFVLTGDFLDRHPGEAELAASLKEGCARIGPGPYAVRSSARCEDGETASHAGQYLSLLDITSADLVQAVRQVHGSGAASHVATYRAAHGEEASDAPSVLVQSMVAARAAGIAFSADPVSGQRDRIVISATAGTAEKLVGGKIDGETWGLGADGSIATAPEGPSILTRAEALDVARLAQRAAAAFGKPQDIEWAIGPEGLVLLQSRPITTPLGPTERCENTLKVFDNSNIVESYPGLVSPLTFSFARYTYAHVYRAFLRLLGVREDRIRADVLDNMLARIDGRVYYNLGNWYRTLALLPGFSLNRGYMETMMGVDRPLPDALGAGIAPNAAMPSEKLLDILRLGRVGLGLAWTALRFSSIRRAFMDRLDEALGADRSNAAAGRAEGSLDALAARYRTMEARLLQRWDAPLINDLLCMIAFGLSRSLMARWGGDAGLHLHADLLIGQGGIISAEPARRIAEMGARARTAGLLDSIETDGMSALARDPELKGMVEAYIARFGDRCAEELKLESPTLAENPAALLQAIVAAGRREGVSTKPRTAPDWNEAFPTRWKRALVRPLARWAQARVRDRENLRFERTRVFGTVRQIFLAMGREFHAANLLENPRDIFLLTVEEVLGAIEGGGLGEDLRIVAARRRQEMDRLADLPDPPERIEIKGAAVSMTPATPGLSSLEGHDSPNEVTRHGTGSSAGRIRARARVIANPRTESLHPGEIMVARHTDPGWIALFANAGGLVVERGSLLSHSAIVARELGIPCVVGLKGATGWIETGDILEIDGTTGEVRKC